MAIEVVLNVFSGRVNPRWVLEPEEETEFLTLLTTAQSRSFEAGQDAPKAPPLGYRGFKIRSTDDLELSGLLEVYGGAVRQGDRTYRDAGRELEKWLLKIASPFVSEELTRRISQELEQ